MNCNEIPVGKGEPLQSSRRRFLQVAGGATVAHRKLAHVKPPLATQISAKTRGFRGVVSIYAKNLVSGHEFGLRPDERIRTASTIKLGIMAAAFDLAEKGMLTWGDEIELREQDKMDPAGVLQEFTTGTRHKLRDLMHLMIVISDNTATNLVIDHVGGEAVNIFLDANGFAQTRLLRKIGGGSPTQAAALPENAPFGLGVSTPHEMGRLMEMISRGDLVSPDASREMFAVLKRQQLREGMGRHLPDAAVASKSGALDALRSDVGLVETKHGRLAMAITVDKMPKKDYSPDNVGAKLIWELTEILVQGLA